MLRAIRFTGLLLLAMVPGEAGAYDQLVEKQVFALPEFTTQGGATLQDVRIGWEAYGTLNEAKDNVILITHYFSGTSHAAGRYAEDDPAPGYWDDLIGPGLPIDTDQFYVISSDTLVNLNVGMPNVTTTGPASLDPTTGEPYGMDFPIVTIRDFVEVQRALLESQGISGLHAVMGASMGALQAYEWAVAYPDRVERLIPVIGAGMIDGFTVAWLDRWAAPIRLDPNWNGGDYYGGEPPSAGLAEALALVTQHAQHWEWAAQTFGRSWAEEGEDPAASFDNLFAIEAALDQAGAARAQVADANHFLYLVKANQLFVAGHDEGFAAAMAKIDAPTLIINQPEDLIFYPELVEETAHLIAADGTPVVQVEIAGTRGHLDGVLSLQPAGEAIRSFLKSEPGE